MGADPIIYCLQQVTDYDQFERFCTDLMTAEGYENIEPLGGRGDKGRDAIRISRSNPDDITIFAYSVREDWFKKLTEDSNRIKDVGHKLNRLVFCCTSHYSATERDKAIEFIQQNFCWRLEIYGLERIRNLLATVHERIITKHTQIFTPPFFSKAGGQTLSYSPDLIIIDFANSDEALASWLAKKLKLHGFLVWCRSIDPIAGESINDTIDSLLEHRAASYLAILSQSAFEDNNLSYRRSSALKIGKKKPVPFLIPIISQPIYDEFLDSNLRSLEKIHFFDSWYSGLNKLLEVLEAMNCPIFQDGKYFSLNPFFSDDVVIDREESIFSNIFEVIEIPEVIQRFESSTIITQSTKEDLSNRWAFRQVNESTFLSFHHPPQKDAINLKIIKNGGAVWSLVKSIDNISIKNLVPELIKKSLFVECLKKGLLLCSNTLLPYFPKNLLKSDRVYFDHLDGTKSYVKMSGERKYYKPHASENYKYNLSPKFYVSERNGGSYGVILHIYIRLTDFSGKPLEVKKIISRRKHLCKNWYNDEWSKRIIAIMKFIANGQNISIGTNDEDKIIISASPVMWTVPVSINEKALLPDFTAQVYEQDALEEEIAIGEVDSD